MVLSNVNRIISLFGEAFAGLHVPVSMAETERVGILVHHAMESKTRAYHTVGHVFNMCEGMNPRQVLAALFHDVVYHQLDAGFPLHCRPLLEGVVRLEGDALLLQQVGSDDDALALCASIFQFQAGQALPLYGGMNEFLSAVVAARLLHPHLGRDDLIAVVAFIESTIPFRRPDSQGRTALERLAGQVELQYRQQHPLAAHEEIQAYVTCVLWDAVKFTNRDVGSFAAADHGLFLSLTWQLIEESSAPLRCPGVYTLREYRTGLVRMEVFLHSLAPDTVFQQVRGLPSDAEMSNLAAVAGRNIDFACDYLGAKITSIAIVEAVARCTGNDGPISMFLGDIHNTYGPSVRLDELLPQAPISGDVRPELLRVLEKGRTLESANDLTTSPLTVFVYRHLGHKGTAKALEYARAMFDASISPLAFLQALDRDMVRAIVHASTQVALSRREALLDLARTLDGPER